MKLRYTGPVTVTFHTAGVGEVEPGAEFTVPDELADSFTQRNDVEEVVEPVEDKPAAKKKAASESSLKPLLAVTGDPVDQTEDSAGS